MYKSASKISMESFVKNNMFLNLKESIEKKDHTIKLEYHSPDKILNKSNLIGKDKPLSMSLEQPTILSSWQS